MQPECLRDWQPAKLWLDTAVTDAESPIARSLPNVDDRPLTTVIVLRHLESAFPPTRRGRFGAWTRSLTGTIIDFDPGLCSSRNRIRDWRGLLSLLELAVEARRAV